MLGLGFEEDAAVALGLRARTQNLPPTTAEFGVGGYRAFRRRLLSDLLRRSCISVVPADFKLPLFQLLQQAGSCDTSSLCISPLLTIVRLHADLLLTVGVTGGARGCGLDIVSCPLGSEWGKTKSCVCHGFSVLCPLAHILGDEKCEDDCGCCVCGRTDGCADRRDIAKLCPNRVKRRRLSVLLYHGCIPERGMLSCKCAPL